MSPGHIFLRTHYPTTPGTYSNIYVLKEGVVEDRCINIFADWLADSLLLHSEADSKEWHKISARDLNWRPKDWRP